MFCKAEKKTVTVNGVQMDYAYFGTGKKTMLIVPGLSLKSVIKSADSVAGRYRDFTEEYTVYIFEGRRNIEAGATIEIVADDIAALMKHLNISDAYAFGASMGGMILQIISAKYPGLLKKMALCSTILKIHPESEPLFTQWIRYALTGRQRDLNGDFCEKLYSDDFVGKYKDALVNMMSDATHDELIKFSILAAACADFDYSQKLKNVKTEALVLGAKNDKVFSPECFYELAEALDCDVYIYDDYGHAVYDEAPDFTKRLRKFFEE